MSNSKAITAGVQSGVVIKTTSSGTDPDFANVTGLLPDCQYLRLKNVDGSYAYIALNEIDVLRTEMESKASAVDVELMQSDINDKATKSQLEEVRNIAEANVVSEETINDILSSLENKAEKTIVDGIAAELLSKADLEDVDALSTIVDGKASKTTVDNLVADLEALKTALGGITDENVVNAIENQIDYLNGEINKRLTIDDLNSLNVSVANMSTTVSQLNELVSDFETRLDNVATVDGVTNLITDVDEITEIINRLESKVATKADTTTLGTKASHDELMKVAQKVATLTTTVNDKITEFTDAINDVTADVGNKVGVGAYNNALKEFKLQIATKADKSVLGPQLNQIERELNTVKQNLEEVEESINLVNYQPQIDSINNSIKTINTKVNEATTSTKNLTKDVDKLNTWKSETAKSLKSQWVRVLSSKEYRNLRPAGENTLEDYNPRYRYPNTVYLVVDYNKPKAIYIGDILVAQSEAKGSIGFAYTFPISF